jgi:hypothetical protein
MKVPLSLKRKTIKEAQGGKLYLDASSLKKEKIVTPKHSQPNTSTR